MNILWVSLSIHLYNLPIYPETYHRNIKIFPFSLAFSLSNPFFGTFYSLWGGKRGGEDLFSLYFYLNQHPWIKNESFNANKNKKKTLKRFIS